MTRIMALLALVFVTSCGVPRGGPEQGVRLVAVGDSILAWNRFSGRDIPQLVSEKTGLPVFNGAISGAVFLGPEGIPTQYPSGAWDWVIVDGGGNDIGSVCGQPVAERAVLNQLIAPDLGGAYAQFLTTGRQSGARIIIMGYAPISDRGGPFAACQQTLRELRVRQERLANATAGVFFVDARDVIRPDDRAAYAIDRVHPTPYAGNLIAGLIAQVINGAR